MNKIYALILTLVLMYEKEVGDGAAKKFYTWIMGKSNLNKLVKLED